MSCIPQRAKRVGAQIKAVYGSVTLDVFAPEQQEWLNYERSIGVLNSSSKWQFIDRGPRKAFELVERYEARRVKDRFDSGVLGAVRIGSWHSAVQADVLWADC